MLRRLRRRAPSRAQFPFGLWRVADGTAIIRDQPCGGGAVRYGRRRAQARTGREIGGRPENPAQSSPRRQCLEGRIFNLDNGKIYDGEISQGDDADHLHVQGCLPGGGLCGGETWKRAR